MTWASNVMKLHRRCYVDDSVDTDIFDDRYGVYRELSIICEISRLNRDLKALRKVLRRDAYNSRNRNKS